MLACDWDQNDHRGHQNQRGMACAYLQSALHVRLRERVTESHAEQSDQSECCPEYEIARQTCPDPGSRDAGQPGNNWHETVAMLQPKLLRHEIGE